jgi:hypothetical protein
MSIKPLFSLILAALWAGSACAATPAKSLSLCAPDEVAVFSCTLVTRQKVSLCAVDVAQKTEHFYYATTHAGDKVMRTPAAGDPPLVFTQTHLVYGGAHGGVAYAFSSQGGQNIVYDIGGPGDDTGGTLQVKAGRVVQAKACLPHTVQSTDNEAVLGSMSHWGHDAQIQAHGLPSMPAH